MEPILTYREIRAFEKNVSSDMMWLGKPTSNGYGQICSQTNGVRRHLNAHRIAWMLYNRCEVPKGLDISHLCGIGLCCRGIHLIAESHAENMRRHREKDYPFQHEHEDGGSSAMANLDNWYFRQVVSRIANKAALIDDMRP